ncbi:MAG: ComEC/Rec2 family competence protein [Alphaproteobacteria bacterium]
MPVLTNRGTLAIDTHPGRFGTGYRAEAGASIRPSSQAARPLRALVESIRANLAAEQDRWFPWFVVAFAGGTALYFVLGSEPSVWLAAGVGVAALALAVSALRMDAVMLRFLCVLVAAIGLGFAAAKIRLEVISAPVLTSDLGPMRIEGRVESVSDLTNGQRVIFVPSRIGRSDAELPRRLRLTVRNSKVPAALEPGQWISVVAVLRPPPEPSMPGGYDFARSAYFDGIGGLAFAFGAPKTIPAHHEVGLLETFDASIERLRHRMTKRIREILPGSEGAIAAALITGDRGSIDEDDNRAFRDSGLAHILSISGLHMALAGLGIFWAVRALLALFPRLVLIYPIKKWAAACAIGASLFYLMISGGGAPPTRSFIMLAMMLLGVLFDRPALTMHPVALAGIAILAFAPESILDAGFHMSFAAIIGLIALAEWQAARAARRDMPPAIWTLPGALLRVRRYFTGIVLVTTVATLATAPFAIFHFNRAGGYSILSNVLADFVVAFIVMPSAAIGVILMPFGLDAWPLRVMGWGVERMMEVAHWVSGLPGAAVLLSSWPMVSLLLIVVGGLWIGIWRRRWRWFGLGPVAAGLLLTPMETPPDVLISRDAHMAGVQQPAGFTILGKELDDYTASQWLLRRGDEREWQSAKAGSTCDDDGCTARSANGAVIALALRPGALSDDCTRADVLVSAVPLRVDCPNPRTVIDRFDVLRAGAIALWLDGDGVKVKTVAEMRGRRPWVASQYRRKRPTSRP